MSRIIDLRYRFNNLPCVIKLNLSNSGVFRLMKSDSSLCLKVSRKLIKRIKIIVELV